MRYVRKAVYVDAVQVTDENFHELAEWCRGEIQNDGSKQYIFVQVHTPRNPRQSMAFVGDWILSTENGYKVYTNYSFNENFTPYAGSDKLIPDEEVTE